MIRTEKFGLVTWDICNYCNAKCKWCKTGRKNLNGVEYSKRFISAKKFEEGINHLVSYGFVKDGCLFELYSWGEPFLNPELIEILEILQKNRFRIGLSTNASNYVEIPSHLLKNIDALVISLSGFTEESYGKIHKLNFDTVKSNIRKFSQHFNKYNLGNKIILNFHVYQYNMDELNEACRFCYENKIIFSPHVAYIADEYLMNKYLNNTLDNDTLNEVSQEILGGMIRKTIDGYDGKDFKCYQWGNLVLDDELNVIPCDLLTIQENVGNLLEFKSLKKLKKAIKEKNCCRTCIESKQAYMVNVPMLFDFDSLKSKYTYPKIYFDKDNKGFTEQNTMMCVPIENGSEFVIEFSFEDNIERFRLDPLENKRCILKNLSVYVNEHKIEDIWTNGKVNDTDIDFDIMDPQIVISNSSNVGGNVRITGKCIWY